MKLRIRILIITLVGMLACVISWLLLSHNSPLFHFSNKYGIEDAWTSINLVPFLLSRCLTIKEYTASPWLYGFHIFLQWSLLGYLISMDVPTGRSGDRAPVKIPPKRNLISSFLVNCLLIYSIVGPIIIFVCISVIGKLSFKVPINPIDPNVFAFAPLVLFVLVYVIYIYWLIPSFLGGLIFSWGVIRIGSKNSGFWKSKLSITFLGVVSGLGIGFASTWTAGAKFGNISVLLPVGLISGIACAWLSIEVMKESGTDLLK